MLSPRLATNSMALGGRLVASPPDGSPPSAASDASPSLCAANKNAPTLSSEFTNYYSSRLVEMTTRINGSSPREQTYHPTKPLVELDAQLFL
jgi:hypothetical protein